MSLSAAIVWEFQTIGNNNNGGGFKTGASGTDYSQQASPQLSLTDLAMTAGGTTLTSATGGFTAAMVGNVIHITAGTNFTAGWYEITAYTDTNTITIDRDATNGSNASAGTGYVGGCLALLTDAFLEQCVAGNTIYMKAGTYTLTENISIVTDGTADLPINIIGYNTTRGDNPTDASRPTIACGSYTFTLGDCWNIQNIIFTGTTASVCYLGINSIIKNCKSTNSSVTADRNAFKNGGAGVIIDCEAISTNGNGIYMGGGIIYGCYVHDSITGINSTLNYTSIFESIIDACTTGVYITATKNYQRVINNTFYGAETPAGTAINGNDSKADMILNNIIYGFATGISYTAEAKSNFIDYNNFYNNTTDVSNATKGDNDTANNPQFTNAANGDFSLVAGSACIGAGFSIRLGV